MNISSSAATDPGAALLEAAEANHRARREAGAEQLRIAREWAFTHRATRRDHGDDVERDVKRIGASGYPVEEFAAAELAIAWQLHPLAAQRVMADAVDLATRFPHTWDAVQELRLEAWVARKIVSLTRDLDLDAARLVDARIADRLALPTSRLFTIVEARVVEADREAAEAKWEQARSERTVHLARETEYGTRNHFARMDAADAVRLHATTKLVAERIEPLEGETADARLARALGILADPQAALDVLAGKDPRGGKAVVYVHTTMEQLESGEGVARVEDLGPFTRRMLQDLLPQASISLRPVIDLNEEPAADCYEIAATITERVHLAQPGDVFPYAASVSRTLDYDHTLRFEFGGPPGQTRPGNLGKLSRRHHRIKTHAPGWSVERLDSHRYLWTTPHGRHLVVDRSGTEPLDRTLERFTHRLDIVA